jgi:hypothetical protein
MAAAAFLFCKPNASRSRGSHISIYRDCASIPDQAWPKNEETAVFLLQFPGDNAFRPLAAPCRRAPDVEGIHDRGWTVFQRRGQFGNPIDMFNKVRSS